MGEADRPGAGDDREEREAALGAGQPRAHRARVEAGRNGQRSGSPLHLLPDDGRQYGRHIVRLAAVRRQDARWQRLRILVSRRVGAHWGGPGIH